MTDEECLNLKFRDKVLVRIGHKVVKAEVIRSYGRITEGVNITLNGYTTGASVRRIGLSATGRPFPKVRRFARDMKLVGGPQSVTANVFADFLEDRGHVEAAELLRKEFPIS